MEVSILLLLVRVPLRTQSLTNVREHWAKRAQRAKRERKETYATLRGEGGWNPPPLPLTVILTRIAPRSLDGDNLQAALKATRDGCADWLAQLYGRGEDSKEGLDWQYAQRREGARIYAVEVQIVRLLRDTREERA